MNGRDIRSSYIPEETLIRIASDNKSGAAEILREAGRVFVELNASLSNSEGLEQTQLALLETCTGLALAQPDMTSILRLASSALSAARTSSDARNALKSAELAARNFIASAEQAARRAAENLVGLILGGSRILTHSRSSTVLAGLLEAKRAGTRFSVVVTESRPMLEGRTLAASLAVEGIPVTLIADAGAYLAIGNVDLVIIGADTITPLNVINKIGTRMIALNARERALRLYAVCDSSKLISEDYFSRGTGRSTSPDELWPDAPPGVLVINNYFEQTPLDWFTGVVSEDGVMSTAETGRRAGQATIDVALIEALRVSLGGVK